MLSLEKGTMKRDLLNIRADRGLSREKLAALSGVNNRTIWKVERGGAIRAITAYKLCRALGIELEQLDIKILELQ